jgi:hypothetical protein
MPVIAMMASSPAAGTRFKSQFPGVSQSPPPALVHGIVAGTTRSSKLSKRGR